MPFTEEVITNQVALIERGIAGVKQSYGFAQNPDNVVGQMPCVLHYIPSYKSVPRAMHNVWANIINLTSILAVTARQQQGGRLRFLENAAIPFGGLWRQAFQDNTNLTNLLAATGSAKCWLNGGNYGSGGQLLTIGGVDCVGYIFTFSFTNA
jgi:hypothetical protein